MSRMRPLMRLLRPAAVMLFSTAISLAQAGGAQTPGGAPAAARPDRGIAPGGAYSVSDIDSVSLTGGSLNMSIPLAGLPPIAGGKLGVTLRATYSSKLWNVLREEVRPPGTRGFKTYVVDRPQPVEHGPWSVLGPGDPGGWSIVGPGYHVFYREASTDFAYVQPQEEETDTEDWQWIKQRWYRVYVLTPDGTEHELTPSSTAVQLYGSTKRPYLHGSFNGVPETVRAPIRYHTTDGTYLTVVYNPDRTWIVTAPDGTQAEFSPDGQRIRDTNGNTIRIYGDAEGVHYVDEQTDRELKVTRDRDGNYLVWYRTVNGDWHHVAVNIDSTRVRGKYYRVNDWNVAGQADGGGQGNTCVRDAVLDKELTVVRDIVFPATEPGKPGRRYSFEYNSDTTEPFDTTYLDACGEEPRTITTTSSKGMGELSRIKTPSDAFIDYSYSQTGTHRFRFSVDDIARNLITGKSVTHDGVTDTWAYDIAWDNSTGTVRGPDGSVATETAFLSDPAYGFQSGTTGGLAGRVFRSRSGNVLIERRWALPYENAYRYGPGGVVAINPIVEAEYTSLIEGGVAVLMSAKKYKYDQNGNLLQTQEYDWFDPSSVEERDEAGVPRDVPDGAPLLRQTDTSYHNTAPDPSSATHYSRRAAEGATLIINAPKETVVGTSVTRYSYDGRAYDVAPTKGHVTEVSRFDDKGDSDDSTGGWITTRSAYDKEYGNLISTTDANGNVTNYYYEDDTHALPTRVDFDPKNETGAQTTLTSYDFWTGLATSTTDQNGRTTDIDYRNMLLGTADPFGRPGVVTGPAVDAGGVSMRRKTRTTYEDSLRRVTVESDLRAAGDFLLKSRTTSDQLGRMVLSEQSEDGSGYGVSTRYAYERAGRVTYVSNPKRGGTATTDGWARATRDDAGRIIEVATFAGATKPEADKECSAAEGCTGRVTTGYFGEHTTVTDQAGKLRRTRVDALGRLVRVDEPSATNNTLGGYDSPAQPTAYSYDTLGNLLQVRQGAQTRTFTYSSLSRLTSATNPEMGRTEFKYDDNGNLVLKIDPRKRVGEATLKDCPVPYDDDQVTVCYEYDGLNRIKSRRYNDGTPDVTYSYDTGFTDAQGKFHAVSNARGRLTQVRSSVSAYNYTSYDAAGRVRGSSQTTDGRTYSMSYGYDLAGGLVSEQYPSGRVVKTEYDAAGRVAGVKDGATGLFYAGADPALPNSPNITYAAHGAVSEMRLGNGRWEHTHFNSRLQPTRIGLGTSATDSSVLKLDYAYGVLVDGVLDRTRNSGDVQSQRVTLPGLDVTQSYEYDGLGRIRSAGEMNHLSPCRANNLLPPTDCWRQEYSYDRYGNRRFAVGTSFPALGQNLDDAVYNPRIDPATNRLVEDQNGDGRKEYEYDAAGNVVRNAQGQTFAYDGDNMQVSFNGGPNANTSGAGYAYDAAGRRVKKVTAAGTTLFVYDAGGALVAEYSTEPPQPGAGGTKYLTADSLGSPRVITDRDGKVVSRHDYAPFGEEVFFGRTGEYRQDSVRQQFTGQERDRESGLDYFNARYYSSAQGRFTSIDPLAASGRPGNPQTWNRYAYVLNNPLRFTDPTGMMPSDNTEKADEPPKVEVTVPMKTMAATVLSIPEAGIEMPIQHPVWTMVSAGDTVNDIANKASSIYFNNQMQIQSLHLADKEVGGIDASEFGGEMTVGQENTISAGGSETVSTIRPELRIIVAAELRDVSALRAQLIGQKVPSDNNNPDRFLTESDANAILTGVRDIAVQAARDRLRGLPSPTLPDGFGRSPDTEPLRSPLLVDTRVNPPSRR